jgi:DNA-binding MarR family transcriptional regulator
MVVMRPLPRLLPMARPTTLHASDWRLGVWRAFLGAHSLVVRRLERDLAEIGTPLAWYDVLLQLAEAPGRRLRMAELAERVLLSRSGLTRLVDRLQGEELVTREPYPGDARGMYTVLTAEGLARLRAAAPIHLAGIQQYWLCKLDDDELRQLGRLLAALEAGLVPSIDAPELGASGEESLDATCNPQSERGAATLASESGAAALASESRAATLASESGAEPLSDG